MYFHIRFAHTLSVIILFSFDPFSRRYVCNVSEMYDANAHFVRHFAVDNVPANNSKSEYGLQSNRMPTHCLMTIAVDMHKY